ncbi:MAG TPA: T9SS type A sorting domain-containing protein [Bacteroidia bacterium]|nr:T9SS type A sorting domain-containing protein [Bacteroidia bacterium]
MVTVNNITAGSTLSLLDLSGRIVHLVVAENSMFTFSIAELSAGIYILEISEGDRVRRQQLVVE